MYLYDVIPTFNTIELRFRSGPQSTFNHLHNMDAILIYPGNSRIYTFRGRELIVSAPLKENTANKPWEIDCFPFLRKC